MAKRAGCPNCHSLEVMIRQTTTAWNYGSFVKTKDALDATGQPDLDKIEISDMRIDDPPEMELENMAECSDCGYEGYLSQFVYEQTPQQLKAAYAKQRAAWLANGIRRVAKDAKRFGLAVMAGVMLMGGVAQAQQCTTHYDSFRKQYVTTCADGSRATQTYDAFRNQSRTTIESPYGGRQVCTQTYDAFRKQWRTTCN